ncbi:MAG TPA: tyrosine-type recombinase/integrase [Methanoregulaceae archaeon]|nr:tyrosine-type recombinase/integrase [Methanoregulaceae archaeon]
MPPSTLSQDHFSSVKKGYANTIIDRYVSTDRITPDDAGLISEFLAERRAAGGISNGRVDKLTFTLVTWRRFIPPYSTLTIGTVYMGIEAIKNAKTPHGRPYKQNTLFDHVSILKQFLLWMIENEYIILPEKKVKAIKTPRKDTITKTASQLLTPEEVKILVKASRSSRDRAMIMTLYEGGFRPGEVCQLKWRDMKSDPNGIAVNVNFKTGITRYIRLVMAKKYISEWRADYPLPITPESFVFLNEKRLPLTWAAMAVQINRIAKRAGMTKHITPHLFRHSRITHLLREGASESVVKMMMWGSLNTDMLMTYAHLTGGDVDAEISRLYGLDTKAGQKSARLEPRICPSCNLINPPGEDYCRGCMEALSIQAIADEDAIRRFVIKNPKAFRQFLDRIEEKEGYLSAQKI